MARTVLLGARVPGAADPVAIEIVDGRVGSIGPAAEGRAPGATVVRPDRVGLSRPARGP